jgi:WD40 repeat protein
MLRQFDAYVTAIHFEGATAAFALGDGTVAWSTGERVEAHDGVILCAADHPSGEGLLTGGDDGALMHVRRSGADRVDRIAGRWIDAVASSPASGLIAFAAGRDVHIRDAADAAFSRRHAHEASVAGLAFDAKGRRVAAATYGGVALWYARIADQKPVMLRWAGSHIAVAFSPDGRFVVSTMQEAALHGWRLPDAQDMRMGGYPAKIKSLAFLDNGLWLATSGAPGVVLWPFSGAQGPMGKQAVEIGFEHAANVTRVAVSSREAVLAAGLDDGRVWACGLRNRAIEFVKTEKGPPISALAISRDRRLAWGDERGGAGLTPLPTP